jgi:ketosteroid isomerase-like protein
MSQENLELVRRTFDAFSRGDFDSAFSTFDPATEWCTAADEPDRQTYRGLAAVRRFVDSLAEPWLDRFEGVMEFEGVVDRGDWVIVPWHARMRGRGSGVPVEVTETYAVRVQDATIVRVEEYRTAEQALEAVRRRGART